MADEQKVREEWTKSEKQDKEKWQMGDRVKEKGIKK